MKLMSSGVVIVALATSGVGVRQEQLTEGQARALLEETFAGADVSIVGVRMEEPRVVAPEEWTERQFVVQATLSGIGDPFHVSAHVSMGNRWRLSFVEHQGLVMSADDLLALIHGDRQRRTIELMRDLATALGVMRLDTDRYATHLTELAQLGYMPEAPVNDAWGNALYYESRSSDTYTLVSLGADGAPGPAPPSAWTRAPYDPDIVLSDGRYTQAPSGR